MIQLLYFLGRQAALAAVLSLGLLSVTSRAAVAAETLLYDGTLDTTPGSQPWLSFLAVGGPAPETVANDATTLETINTDSAGYSNYSGLAQKNANFPPLNPVEGFRLSFTVSVNSEDHSGVNGPNRAGFSVILLGSDKQGIELGFWADEIWAQEGGSQNLFTKAEGAAFDTSVSTTYDLTIVGNSYMLGSGATPILSGSVRDYSAFSGFPDVYDLPSFIFLGDDTSSAHANITLAEVVLATPVVGDMNGDGQRTVDDNAQLELALTLEDDYLAAFPLADYRLRGDLNGNGIFDNFDMRSAIIIAPGPLDALSQSAIMVNAVAVPEPSGWILMGLATAALGAVHRRRSARRP